jgi:very-short-patch-repair endonuclease
VKFDPKKRMKQLLRAAKRLPKVRKPIDKQKYLEGQAKKMDKNPTGCEILMIELLELIKVKYETQKIVHGKIFDFYIPEKNTLIEVDGSYWHSYGLKVEDMSNIQLKIYKNDQKKDVLAKGLGYNLIRVWEHELQDELFEETKERLRRELR